MQGSLKSYEQNEPGTEMSSVDAGTSPQMTPKRHYGQGRITNIR